jgi:hypothetical protein
MLALLRSLLGKHLMPKDEGDDLSRTYRPTRDWSVPIEQVLEQLPPEALAPPGEGGGRQPCLFLVVIQKEL